MAKAKFSEEQLISKALGKARAALQEKAVAGASQLGRSKIRSRVILQLQKEGFELAGNRVRVALESQLSSLLEAGAHTPLPQLAKRLGGTTSAEAKKYAVEFCEAGKARLILRGKVLSLVPASEKALEPLVLKRLLPELAESLTWLKNAALGKPPASVLRSDWVEVLDRLTSILPIAPVSGPSVPSAVSSPPKPESDWVVIRGALTALADQDTGLTSVPELVRRLSEQLPRLGVKALLLRAYRDGRVELRPEGGIGKLSALEAALCPVGAEGLPLSWVRLLDEDS